MSARIDMGMAAPELVAPIVAAYTALAHSTLDKPLAELVFLRVSQINGCAYCLDLHTQNLRKSGESERRLALLPAWRETELFDGSERAALAWAEALTLISESHAPEAVYRPLLDYFTERQIGELTFAIALMNMLNRTGIGLRKALPDPAAPSWPEEVRRSA